MGADRGAPMPAGRHPHFDAAEFGGRVARLKSRLRHGGVDLALFDEIEAMTWLSGFGNSENRWRCVGIPLEGEPFFLIRALDASPCRQRTWIADVPTFRDWEDPLPVLAAALAGFVAAAVSDAVDGFVARVFHQKSRFGALLDPLADKLMVLSVMLMLAIKGIAPWAAICILLAKEALMLLGGLLLYRRNIVVYAMPIGKIAQLVTVVALIACFFHEHFVSPVPPVHLYLLWAGVSLAVISLVYYAKQNGVKLFQAQSGQDDQDCRR